MKTIVVTGGAGYIGSVVIRSMLNEGFRVVCLDKLVFGGSSLLAVWGHANFKLYRVDICDSELVNDILSIEQPYAVIHLAAIVGDPACALNPNLSYRVNWEASVNLYEASIRNGVERFIFASTCSNYGKMSSVNGFVDESSVLAPISLYAELKVKFENFMLSNKGREDFSPTALRFSTVYGISPRMRFDLTINEFTKELFYANSLEVFGEQFWRPYCHVDDFARAFILVLGSPKEKVSSNVYNVGDTNENYTKQMVIDEIRHLLPESKVEYVKKNDDPRDYRVNCDKIKQDLGFRVSKKVSDGIREIIDALSNGILPNPESQMYYNIPHHSRIEA